MAGMLMSQKQLFVKAVGCSTWLLSTVRCARVCDLRETGVGEATRSLADVELGCRTGFGTC